jgi:tetratricopeptide (TPR) repeat protein
MGLALLALEQYTDSIVNLEFVVERDPWNVRARRGLANAYKGAGQINAAIDQYKRILVINPKDQEARDFLKLYNIEYIEAAFLDQWFNYPGKALAAGGPPGLPEADAAELRYRIALADELARHARFKQARYIYEKLVQQDPANAYYRLALANIYLQSGMLASAKHELGLILAMDPNNAEAKAMLAAVEYQMSPRLTTTAMFREARQFNDYTDDTWIVNEVGVGERFTYLWGDGGEVFGEVAWARYNQTRQDPIDRVSPRVGAVVGLFGEVSLRGEIGAHLYSGLPTTLSWLTSATTNIYDYVGLDAYYFREDIQQTVLGIREGVGAYNVGGVLRVWPVERLTIRGEYRHLWIDGGRDFDQNQSDLASGAVAYTFFNGPYFTPGYIYTFQHFDDELPNVLGMYSSPWQYQSHALELDLRDDVTQDVIYNVGLLPQLGITNSQIQDQDLQYILGLYGGVEWYPHLQHKLGLNLAADYELEQGDFFEYQIMLTYMYIFGKHKGEWRALQQQPPK